MDEIYKKKIIKLKKLLDNLNYDAILINNFLDVVYFTGFKDFENNTTLLILKNKNFVFSDGRFKNQIIKELKSFNIIIVNSQKIKFNEIYKTLKKENIHKILLPYNDITYKESIDLKTKKLKTKNCEELINKIRRKKDENEIKLIKKACQISEKAFINTIKEIKIGMTEIKIKKILENNIYKYGGNDIAFPTIIASGKQNGASPHAIPTNRKIKEGDLITIDFGAVYKNYCSDITRTICVNKINKKQKNIYKAVKKAKEESEKLIKKGNKVNKIHNKAKKIIEKYNDKFLHGIGHGLGTKIHEFPFLNETSEEKLEVGDVFTIEPGIYIPGVGGVRIEDDYLITETGYECLTPNITTDLITI